MIVAGGGLILIMAQIAIQTQAPLLSLPTAILTWLTWMIVGVIATVMGTAQSVQNLARYGLHGITRPRWWFEAARIFWAFFLLGLLTLPLGLLSLNVLFVMVEIVATFGLFFATASVGYLLTFWQHRRFRGRAFECVNFFYTIVGGVCLVGYAASHWPPANPLIDGFLLAVTGLGGIALLLAGFISGIIQYERRQPQANGTRANEN